ncbi:hypothetical protein N7533_010171 [Penicillium manginii]|uniref:uncharacterized protein n=1 Tax=Penicillium manginii TaxID=203109 RepID=UPI002546B7CD|nr:uncharacterized protein N7533_010171 [Penicillium manginii]KAJ5743069.1 hypothetical protein N7533_010171 [Penicillium manginii]
MAEEHQLIDSSDLGVFDSDWGWLDTSSNPLYYSQANQGPVDGLGITNEQQHIQPIYSPFDYLSPDTGFLGSVSTSDVNLEGAEIGLSTSTGNSPLSPLQSGTYSPSMGYVSPYMQHGTPRNPPLSHPPSGVNTPPRGLPRRRSRYFMPRSTSKQTSNPIMIPSAPQTEQSLDPMQRWQESPPEDEPASMSAIMDAVNNAVIQDNARLSDYPSTASETNSRGGSIDAFRQHRGRPSSTSGDSGTSISSKFSGASHRSAGSGVSGGSLSHKSQARVGKSRQTRGQIKGQTKGQTKASQDTRRRYCCTFCCDRFKSKYDWARHEKSLHLNLEKWVCTPFGGVVFSSTTNRTHCAYCHALEPSSEHLSLHNHLACQGNNPEFRRKDHLTQHLRHTHKLKVMPLIDDWKIAGPAVSSRCGFCETTMSTWAERIEHLAGHFRGSTTMKEWRGDHGFAPFIAAQVKNWMPPYMIGSESHSLIPFSATDYNVRDHLNQISARVHDEETFTEQVDLPTLDEIPPRSQLSSFTEVLTKHLSQYAQRQMKLGIVPTDEMFQRESRRIVYDTEDSWNQSIADNSEWLDAFRRLHCQPMQMAESSQVDENGLPHEMAGSSYAAE